MSSKVPKPMADKPPARSTRRSQAERRDATRTRILDATLHCLAVHGYAGTGVARVVDEAGVSRGAWSHHFPSMNALMLDVAKHLMGRVYERLGAVLQELSQGKGGAEELIATVWHEFFASEVNEIYLQLLVASRREPGLAERLVELTGVLERNLEALAMHRFAPVPDAVLQPIDLLLLTRWVLRGIALDRPLLTEDEVDRGLKAWSRLAESQLRPGPGSRKL
jgi:AcrR family transcriptional regulator